MAGTIVRQGILALKGSPLSGGPSTFGGENPQPLFRQKDLAVYGGPNFPEDKKNQFRARDRFSHPALYHAGSLQTGTYRHGIPFRGYGKRFFKSRPNFVREISRWSKYGSNVK